MFSIFHRYIIVLILLAVGVIARLWVVVDLPLTADEAHYALYATHLDWSYFDHPPMVGWLQFISVSLWGTSEMALRLMPNAIHVMTGVVLFILTMRLYPNQWVVAFVAVVLFECTLMFQLMGIAMLPDNPLLLFTILSIFCFDYAYRTNQWSMWILYGLSLGLMGLSKYTAILVALGYFFWIVLYCPRLLLNVRLWFAAMLGLLLISPVIYWNIEHDWLSFSYQLEHSNVESNTWSWLALARGQLINVLAYGMLLFLGLWIMITSIISNSIRRVYSKSIKFIRPFSKVDVNSQDSGKRMHSLINIIIVCYVFVFAYSSAQEGHYLPHWVSLSFILITPYSASKLVSLYQRLKSRVVATTLIVLISIVVITPFGLSIALLNGKLGSDATYQAWRGVVGWKESAEAAKKLIQTDNTLAEYTTIYVANWSEASRIAWYARPVPVFSIDNRINQFDLWFDDMQEKNQHALKKGLLIAPLKHDELESAMSQFQQCKLMKKLPFSKRDQSFIFGIWKCSPF